MERGKSTAKSVGKSTTRRGENVSKQEGKEAGRYETGTKSKSQRPVGKSTARDATGVNPQKTVGE